MDRCYRIVLGFGIPIALFAGAALYFLGKGFTGLNQLIIIAILKAHPTLALV